MVVTQLVERSLPTPEIRGSNTVIGNFIREMSETLDRRNRLRIE